MRKLGVLFALLGLAAMSPAPIKETPPPGTEPLPEHSRQQLVDEQAHQRVQKEVGRVDRDADHDFMSGQSSESDASATIQSAAAQQKGAEIVKEASKRVDSGSSAWSMVFWGILLAILGFGSVYALRYWVAKNVPLPGNAKNRVSW